MVKPKWKFECNFYGNRKGKQGTLEEEYHLIYVGNLNHNNLSYTYYKNLLNGNGFYWFNTMWLWI